MAAATIRPRRRYTHYGHTHSGPPLCGSTSPLSPCASQAGAIGKKAAARYQELEKQKENGQAGDLLSTATFLEGGAGAVTMRTYEERLMQGKDHQEVMLLPLRTAASGEGEERRRATALAGLALGAFEDWATAVGTRMIAEPECFDEARRELVYAHAQGLAVSLSATAESLLIKGNAGRLQVDNQIANGPRIALASPWQSEAGVSFLDADLELARSVTSVMFQHSTTSTSNVSYAGLTV